MAWISRFPLRYQILLGALVVLGLMLVTATIATIGIRANSARDRDAEQATAITLVVDDLLADLMTVEVAYRGFLITGDELSLRPYYDAIHAITLQFDQLHDQTLHDSAAQERLDTLRATFMRWRTETLDPSIDLRRLLGSDERAGFRVFLDYAVSTTTNFEAMRSQIMGFREDELDLMHQRRQATLTANTTLQWVLFVGWTVTGLACVAIFWLLSQHISRRVGIVMQAANRTAAGERAVRCELPPASDEVGQLASAFDVMAATIERRTQESTAQYAAAQRATQAVEEAYAQAAAQLQVIDQQRAVIRDMSIPVLPVAAGVVVMPLIGILDDQRMNQAIQQGLHTIRQHAVTHLILDITGVPVVDAVAARGLLEIVEAVRLLGTQMILVGIHPDVAQTLVHLGIDVSGLVICATLHQAIRYTHRARTPGIAAT